MPVLDGQQWTTPRGWLSKHPAIPINIIREVEDRLDFDEWDEDLDALYIKAADMDWGQDHPWSDEILAVRKTRAQDGESDLQSAMERRFKLDLMDGPEVMARILCQALDMPATCCCKRSLMKGQTHETIFWTNRLVIQIYCVHRRAEFQKVERLISKYIPPLRHHQDKTTNNTASNQDDSLDSNQESLDGTINRDGTNPLDGTINRNGINPLDGGEANSRGNRRTHNNTSSINNTNSVNNTNFSNGKNPLEEEIKRRVNNTFLFDSIRGYLVCETIYPEGIDMEALSPRDINAHIRVKPASSKQKTAPAKLSQKEKDHPPPPPDEVREPPSSDRKNGAIYKTGRCLGKGGFAICYEGLLSGTKQKYALKIVKSAMPVEKMRQKFQTELQIHSKMRHANIVQFHRAFSFDQCTFIVLELCPNGSLMDMVKKRKYITEPEVRYWTVQMAGAIKYMHAKGIIHRDLKMGNIFLDKNMNVKIGDFGLAALLMTGKEMQAARRTTLCGTPNYIAPEILSKDKSGHDHAVDIWSLGIIIFAMLTGKPPFQSPTADEIYRRARELEYDWPKLDTSENFISEETKKLVEELLQAPEKRPDPDRIVQHEFFTCGWMPVAEEMTASLREKHPDPTQFLSVGTRGGRSNAWARNLKKLCIKCEVGPWSSNSKRHDSTYRECVDEEKVGLTPQVPLPDDIVYRPYHEVRDEFEADVLGLDEEDSTVADTEEIRTAVPLPQQNATLSSRPAIQSFAAQQRARPQASISNQSNRLVRRQPGQEPLSRPLVHIANKMQSRKNDVGVPEAEPVSTKAVENRLAADLMDQLRPIEVEKDLDAPTISLELSPSIFNPKSQLEHFPDTTPDRVFASICKLQAELERALNSRTMAIQTTKSRKSNPSIVVKWVDYTNRHGIGYILNNGSVGCIFKSSPADRSDPRKGRLPLSYTIVRNGELHLRNRCNLAYPDRCQLVPLSGHLIEFYENNGDKGISGDKLSPASFKCPVTEDGEMGKLARGTDVWDDRRRSNIVLWKKFANYMFSYGRDQDYITDENLAKGSDGQADMPAGNFITFYQRWGDVGCWLYSDGHYQFNFPDHTKILLSGDGVWCDFYHLPLEAARELSQKGSLPANALDDRQHLSYPLQTLLNFMVKPSRTIRSTTRKRPDIDPMIQGIPEANDFRKKIQFINTIVKEWIKNGGLGKSDITPEKRLRWNGYREKVNVKAPYKHVWVALGGQATEERRVAWFDPKYPEKVYPDMQE